MEVEHRYFHPCGVAASSRKTLENMLHHKEGIKPRGGNKGSIMGSVMKGTPRMMGKGDPRTATGLAAIDYSTRAGGKPRGYQRSMNISSDLHNHVFGKMDVNTIRPRKKN